MNRHLEDMRFNGWEAVNRSNGMRMHGCSDDATARCFSDSSYRDRTNEWSAGKGQLRNSFNCNSVRVLDSLVCRWTLRRQRWGRQRRCDGH